MSGSYCNHSTSGKGRGAPAARKTEGGASRRNRQRSALQASSILANRMAIEGLEPRLLMSADAVPIQGSIDVPGETDQFVFQLTQPKKIYFDSLTNTPLNWSLTGPGGAVVQNRAIGSSDSLDTSGSNVMDLQVGEYTITVDGAADRTGAYAFRLLDLASAQGIALDQRIAASNPGKETDLYKFDVALGETVFFDTHTLSGQTVSWRLLGPDGELVTGPQYYGDSGPMALSRTGTGTRNTIARITYQRFFRRYLKLSGMSGTVREVAGELWADYGVRVDAVPRNRPNQRQDRGHVMWRTLDEKWHAVAQEVLAVQHGEGQRPILIGTRSVADSERVALELQRLGIAHRVLNARQDAEEAEIVAAAGQCGAVTVATNMAGRGTDIELSSEARAAGGLHVVLTAFHETARIDRQLFGRAGRQGDPGSTCSITSAEDELYLLHAPFWRRVLLASAKSWPVHGGPADWLRKAAQGAAERHHASVRRQTELHEERLKKALAFSGAD